jgi:phenylalanyl-tRNA synthetase beta chain
MNLSTQWLSELTGQTVSPDSTALMLTMAGLEEESSHEAAPDFSGVVVGQVIAKDTQTIRTGMSVFGNHLPDDYSRKIRRCFM